LLLFVWHEIEFQGENIKFSPRLTSTVITLTVNKNKVLKIQIKKWKVTMNLNKKIIKPKLGLIELASIIVKVKLRFYNLRFFKRQKIIESLNTRIYR